MSGPSRRAVRRPVLAGALLGTLFLVAAACAPMPPPPATGLDPNTAPQAGVAAYTGDGPYEVGVTTLQLSDRKVEVWYPADNAQVGSTPKDVYFIRSFIPPTFDPLIPPGVNPPYETNAYRDVPAAAGSFPLTIFSHGAAGFRLTTTELTTHVASWGFIVISPDYLERGLANALGSPPATPRSDTLVAGEAIDAVKAASATPGGLLDGRVNSTKVYPWGHSAGGGTTLRLLQRPDVDTGIPMAAGISPIAIAQGSATPLPAGKNITWLAGRQDGIAAVDNVRTGYDYTPGEKKIVEFEGGGHNNGFTDLCEIGGGGVAALAVATGLPVPEALLNLGNDGCVSPPFADSPVLWPQIGHFLVAEFRYRAGIDAQPVGLGDQVTASLPNVIRYSHAP